MKRTDDFDDKVRAKLQEYEAQDLVDQAQYQTLHDMRTARNEGKEDAMNYAAMMFDRLADNEMNDDELYALAMRVMEEAEHLGTAVYPANKEEEL